MNKKGGNIYMDIIEYAKKIDWGADYYDPHTGYIYHLIEVGRAWKFFHMRLPITVTCDGHIVGHISTDNIEF